MEKIEVSIRPAVKADCRALLDLVRELAVYERAPDAVTVSLQHFEASGFGPAPVWRAFVAVDAKAQVIGFALYYIRFSTWKGQRMYLEDLLVTEDWRGKGIGTLLMNTLLEEARQKKFSGIAWQVLDWNEPAIRFYKRYNAHFEGEWLNVSIEL